MLAEMKKPFREYARNEEIPLAGYFEPDSSTEVQDPVRRQTLTVYLLVIADPHADVKRGDRIVQYTRYARLERPIGGGRVRLGRLGEDFLRLPGGVPYRWP